MRKASDARKRTLALQDRALRFSAAVNAACPKQFHDVPSATVWSQLVRAADSTSNNLVEADDASSTADFVHKMRLALREAKESRQCLAKVRLSSLAGVEKIAGLEQEADQLAAIFATIVLNVLRRLNPKVHSSQFTVEVDSSSFSCDASFSRADAAIRAPHCQLKL